MCGIAGYWNGRSVDHHSVIEAMTTALYHRGPDKQGLWVDQNHGLAFGHQRLSIIDLSSSGDQPQFSQCGRYVTVFNGEIYNHLQLREELQAAGKNIAWQGHSDTETLLAVIAHHGVREALLRLRGMFAFALWDTQAKTLTLARDRIGEKPLYYALQGGAILFASELKALRAAPGFDARINRNAVALMMRYSCVPAPHCILEDVAKLEPGHFLELDINTSLSIKELQPEAYWRYNDAVESGLANSLKCDASTSADLLEQQLRETVALQMQSDVPLGAFLSGGIDSSTIVALMQAQSSRAIQTFAIGFNDENYNEAKHASAVAVHLGTDHTEMYMEPADALTVIPNLANIYCEPFSDSSQIPTFIVASLAKKKVQVSLSGDGGDELFGGYNRYTGLGVWRGLSKLPLALRKTIAKQLQRKSVSDWERIYDRMAPLIPAKAKITTPGDKLHKIARICELESLSQYLKELNSHWNSPEDLVLNSSEPSTILSQSNNWPETDCEEHWMMALDAQHYMPDDILVKVDRAAMANSLETRVPFLDHKVVELAWQIPLEHKISGGLGKQVLREVLYRYVPRNLIERPKAGFGMPLHTWLREDLRDWAEDLLSEERLRREGIFNVEMVRSLWRRHLSGEINAQHYLWDVLMFQSWYQDFQEGKHKFESV